MKLKLLFTAVWAASAALTMSGCGDDEKEDKSNAANLVAQENREVASGKCFKMAQGTVTYDDGSVLTFTDYGKTWSLLQKNGDNNGRILIKDGKYYAVNDTKKTYAVAIGLSDEYKTCPRVFREAAYEWGSEWQLEERFRKSEQTIANKNCTVFSTSTTQFGGWSRIVFLVKGKGNDITAETWSDKADEKMLSLEGYREI